MSAKKKSANALDMYLLPLLVGKTCTAHPDDFSVQTIQSCVARDVLDLVQREQVHYQRRKSGLNLRWQVDGVGQNGKVVSASGRTAVPA